MRLRITLTPLSCLRDKQLLDAWTAADPGLVEFDDFGTPGWFSIAVFFFFFFFRLGWSILTSRCVSTSKQTDLMIAG